MADIDLFFILLIFKQLIFYICICLQILLKRFRKMNFILKCFRLRVVQNINVLLLFPV